MKKKYTDKIREIAANTFEVTCYMFPLEKWEIDDTSEFESPGNIMAVVRFDGAAEGAMIINPSDTLLQAAAMNMLGIEKPAQALQNEALCEIANIICGNTVPLFASNRKICYIRPPFVATPDDNPEQSLKNLQHEAFDMFLDEGMVRISIYYSMEAS